MCRNTSCTRNHPSCTPGLGSRHPHFQPALAGRQSDMFLLLPLWSALLTPSASAVACKGGNSDAQTGTKGPSPGPHQASPVQRFCPDLSVPEVSVCGPCRRRVTHPTMSTGSQPRHCQAHPGCEPGFPRRHLATGPHDTSHVPPRTPVSCILTSWGQEGEPPWELPGCRCASIRSKAPKNQLGKVNEQANESGQSLNYLPGAWGSQPERPG